MKAFAVAGRCWIFYGDVNIDAVFFYVIIICFFLTLFEIDVSIFVQSYSGEGSTTAIHHSSSSVDCYCLWLVDVFIYSSKGEAEVLDVFHSSGPSVMLVPLLWLPECSWHWLWIVIKPSCSFSSAVKAKVLGVDQILLTFWEINLHDVAVSKPSPVHHWEISHCSS